jgi:hypothetical protein
MSSRSDVGVAIKAEALKHLRHKSPKVVDWLEETSDEINKQDEGTLFMFFDIKWPLRGMNPDIDAFYSIQWSDFLIVEACFDYPEKDGENDIGLWHDNPWNLRKEVSVNVLYEAPI